MEIALSNNSRRQFVKGLAFGGAVSYLGLATFSALATVIKNQSATILTGSLFKLNISTQLVNFTGNKAIATTVNNGLPAPTLRYKEGDDISIDVTNTLDEDSSIHWHGLILPSEMDGVPNISDGFSGIKPGETFKYRFKAAQSGTYWYHSHSGFQEQTGLYGAIIIDPIEDDPYEYDQDHIVMLSDWTDENPKSVYYKLKKLSHYYNLAERTHTDVMDDVSKYGVKGVWNSRGMWNDMRMSDRDLADVTGMTYTYLMNGQTPNEGWTSLFKKGEKIRLRFINASAMSFFDVRIPGLKMTVIASDGQLVQPVEIDEFRIGVAETYDVIVEPDEKAYSIFAQSIDRSGYTRGTLTPDINMKAEVPPMDVIPNLSHTDMGMDMSDMSGMDHSGHDMSAMKKSEPMDHSGHDMSAIKKSEPMDHSGHDMSAMDMSSSMDHSGHNMSKMDHRQHDMGLKPNPSDFSAKPVKHYDTEYGPHIDMRADGPIYRLDDPGVGLRNNGRKVLTYADLKNLYPTNNEPEPTRELELHLTGNMGRYMWSINGIKYSDAETMQWKMGERIRITLVNDTMMNHPMHLHGMWSDLESGDNNYLPRKHTIISQPGSRTSYRVTVDAKGGWPYHCHLLYHMLSMFRSINVT
jgi:CopA family copper-resistance protein